VKTQPSKEEKEKETRSESRMVRVLDLMKDFDPEQVKLGPAKHTSLDEFEAIHMPFDDPVAPRK